MKSSSPNFDYRFGLAMPEKPVYTNRQAPDAKVL